MDASNSILCCRRLSSFNYSPSGDRSLSHRSRPIAARGAELTGCGATVGLRNSQGESRLRTASPLPHHCPGPRSNTSRSVVSRRSRGRSRFTRYASNAADMCCFCYRTASAPDRSRTCDLRFRNYQRAHAHECISMHQRRNGSMLNSSKSR